METPTPTQTHKQLPNDAQTNNPFADPDEGSIKIAESRQDGITPNDAAIMDPVSTPPATDSNAFGLKLSSSSSPPLVTRTQQPGAPQPLRLPPPKTPPPGSESSRTSVSNTPELSCDEEQPVKGKWWTEWLCGCSEGPDRGGDNQVSQDPKLFGRFSPKYTMVRRVEQIPLSNVTSSGA